MTYIDVNSPRYIITLIKTPDNCPRFITSESCVYPNVVNNFSLSDTYNSIENAKKYIDTLVQFNMWKPQVGLTFDNIKIQEVTFNFKDVT